MSFFHQETAQLPIDGPLIFRLYSIKSGRSVTDSAVINIFKNGTSSSVLAIPGLALGGGVGSKN